MSLVSTVLASAIFPTKTIEKNQKMSASSQGVTNNKPPRLPRPNPPQKTTSKGPTVGNDLPARQLANIGSAGATHAAGLGANVNMIRLAKGQLGVVHQRLHFGKGNAATSRRLEQANVLLL